MIDHTIYNRITTPKVDPNEWQANALKLSALRDSNALAKLQLQQAEQGMADENALRSIYRTAGGDQGKLRDLLYGQGFYKQGMALDEAQGKQRKLNAEIGETEAKTTKVKAEAFLKQLEGRRDALAAVTNQASYEAWKESIARLYGPDVVAGVPKIYDHNWQRQSLMNADKTIEDAWKQAGFARDDARLAETQRHNRATEAATIRGQDLTDARARETQRAQDGTPAQAKLALENSTTNLDRLISEAKAIQQSPALGRITGIVGVAPSLPGGAAADTEARLETLKSQVAFSVLQAMRDASKTGGALGQVSERELAMLQNNLAALDTKQSPQAFAQSLQQIVDYAEGVKQRMNQAYAQQYGGAPAPAAPAAQPQPQPQAEASKQIGGKTYIKINGQWFEQ